MPRFIEGQDRQPGHAAAGVAGRLHRRGQPGAGRRRVRRRARSGGAGLRRRRRRARPGRPSYHPAVLLKIYIYGYLNRIQSSRRLERECQRNVELMWLTGRLAPDFKTIADFRRDNGTGIRNVCRRFVVLCRELKLFSQAVGRHRRQQVQGGQQPRPQLHAGQDRQRASSRSRRASQRYLDALDTADRTQPGEFEAKTDAAAGQDRRRCASRCADWTSMQAAAEARSRTSSSR